MNQHVSEARQVAPSSPVGRTHRDYAERPVRLGPTGGIAGMLCEPAPAPGSAETTQRPVFLLWNVGLNHRVGPYRIYVDLARALAAEGFGSIRFDLSGLGDSEAARGGAQSDSERAVLDVQAALDGAEQNLGSRRAVLVGFCSSVDSAHHATLADDRVVGLVNIEGYSFPSQGQGQRYALRFLDVNRWARWAYHQRKKREQRATVAEQPSGPVFQREYPTAARLASEYRALTARGVRLLCAYVRGDSDYEYRDQLFDALGAPDLRTHVEVEFYPQADHIFSRVTDRKILLQRIVRFARERF